MQGVISAGGRRPNRYIDRRAKAQEAPARKREKKPSVLFGKMRKVLLVVVGFIACLALAIGIGKLFVLAYDTAVTSSLFTTKTIEVDGNVRLPRDLVLEYAGLKEGQNSLSVNIATIEQNLRRTPWVSQVSVQRLLPDTFVIRLRERMPSFWVHHDGVLYYANEEGEIIAPVESSNFLSLPAVVIEAGAEELRPSLIKFKEAVRSGELPFEMATVSQITLSLSKGIEFFLEDREIWVSFDPADWHQNVTKIKMVFEDLVRRREMKNVRELRVVDGNVWVVLNTRAASLSPVD